MGWIDVHTHFNMLKTPIDDALKSAQSAGVDRFITIGTGPDDHQLVLDIAKKYFPVIACTIGVHPHEGSVYNDEVEKQMLSHLGEKEVVAVGEIGLDYYYNKSEKSAQIEAFERQMLLAEKFSLPVEIHTRDAEDDTIEILKKFKGRVRGLLHCFTGTMELAKAGLENGFDISFSGVVTFKNADPLREVARYVPLDRMHVETDAPFLAPVPMRGQSNVPEFVIHTAHLISSIKQIDATLLMQQTKINATHLFKKLVWNN